MLRDRKIRQLDNSALLVQAASGLHRHLGGTKGTSVLKDSTVAQISAAIYYQASVLSKITGDAGFQSKFRTVIFKQLQKDFGEYIDAQARANPSTLHHVYEWKKVGSSNARLFELQINSTEGLSFTITSSFKPSKSIVPTSFGKSRHVFTNKAIVMENGSPVTIKPRNSRRLVFEIDGQVIRMPEGKSVTVKRPGGGKATGRFQISYARFFTGNLVSLSIKKSGFQRIFNSDVTKALKVPFDVKKVKYSFSPNTLNMQAESAVKAAFGGSL